MIVQNIIYAINMYNSDYTMICSTSITSVANTLKKIYLGGTLWCEFTSDYYNDKNYTFRLFFQPYKASAVNKIYHISIVNKWKDNTEIVDYNDKHSLCVYIPYVKR